METWKPVHRSPFDTVYEVSNLGRVRRLPSTLQNGRNHSGGVLAPVAVRGYHMVLLQVAGDKWMPRVHHLVAFAFVGDPPGPVSVTGWTINHKNFNKTDNRAENLEWMTAKENHDHAVRNGLKSRGERHYKAILTETIVREMRKMRAAGFKIRDISDHFGVKEHAAADVLLGRSWAHVTP